MTAQPSPLPLSNEEEQAFQQQPVAGAAPPKRQEPQAAPQDEKNETAKKSPTAFRTISEVADELSVQQHVLRFWETKFSQIRPLKRGGGRRYYRPEDVDLLRTIYKLLYTEGYTIKGAQKLFREKGKGQVVEKSPPPQNENRPQGFSDKQRTALKDIAGELRALRAMVGK